MSITHRLILSVALPAAFFVGCETTPDILYDQEPAARLEAMRFGGVELDFATLLFDIEIDNPYPVSLSLQRLSYALSSEGSTFLTAAALDNLTVPPNTKKVLTLSDEVIYANLLRALGGKPGTKIPFKAELTLSLNAPRS
ncbi:MAG: LEA type 2 family protein, partial [Planctomycetota bacterium]